jgi:AraC-like DNA-binding protein
MLTSAEFIRERIEGGTVANLSDVDVLSDVMAVMHCGQPRVARVEWDAPWGQRFPAIPGAAGFRIVLSGPCWCFPDEGEPFLLAVGDVLFLPHGGGHGLADAPSTPLASHVCEPQRTSMVDSASGDTEAERRSDGRPSTVTLCGAYELDSARGHPLLGDLPAVLHLPALLGHQSQLRTAVDLLSVELERSQAGTDALVRALLDALLLYILRAWLAQTPTRFGASGWAAALADPAVGAALHAIHRDPARQWTVAELGVRAGLSRAAFSRRFARCVGQPPLAYLRWWRLTTAMRLLRSSDAPLSVVASRVGYGSEFAFASAFKREFRVTPGRYRRDRHTDGTDPGARR